MSEANRLRTEIDILKAQRIGYEHMAEQLAQTSALARGKNPHDPMLAVWSGSIDRLEEQQDAASSLIGQLQRQLDEIENGVALIEVWRGHNLSER